MADDNTINQPVKNKGGRPRNKRGRKTIINETTLNKLKQAFALDCTDDEACLYAEISPSTLYNYQLKNTKFLEQKRLLKNTPVLKARNTVVNGLTKDADLALKYLERKKSDEFSVKQKIEAAIGGQEMIEGWKKELGISQDNIDQIAEEDQDTKGLPGVSTMDQEDIQEGTLPVPDQDQPEDT